MRKRIDRNVSFISTVYNEEHTIQKFIWSLFEQTVLPGEIVIVDANSSDSTSTILHEIKKTLYKQLPSVRFTLLQKKGNRSVGRNIAIKKAKAPIIVVSDSGCILKNNWLYEITQPFKRMEVDVVAGFYKPIAKTVLQKCLSTYTCVMQDKVTKDFLPSSRSVAFRKSAWKKVGGYPEQLETCEDLVFARNLKRKGFNFIVNKKAIVFWPQRKNIFAAAKQFYSYAKGDGRAKYIRPQTPLLLLRYLFGVIFLIIFFKFRMLIVFYIIVSVLVLYILWSIFKNYRYVKNPLALLFLPLLQFVSDIAVILGMTIGLLSYFIASKSVSDFRKNLLVRNSLSRTAIFGGGWISTFQVGTRFLSVIKYAVIARVLYPTEIGLYSLVLLTIGIVESFTEFGITQFLIQRENHNAYIDAAFILSVLRGIILFLLLLILIYPLAVFYNRTDSIGVFLVIPFVPLIKGFINPRIADLQKYLKFRQDVIYRSSVIAFETIGSIIFVLILRSIWALMVSLLASTIFDLALTYLIAPHALRIKIEKKKLLTIFHFSKWVTSSSGLYALSSELDSFVIGKIMGVGSLGVYQLTQRFSLNIMSETSDIAGRVSFPIFSNIKKDVTRLKRGFYKSLFFSLLIWGSLSLILFIFSREFITIALGRKWLIANTTFRIFCVVGFIQAMQAVITSLFLGIGRQDLTAKLSFIRLSGIVIAIVPLTYLFGLNGASASVLFGSLLTVPLVYLFLKRLSL